MGDAFSGLTAGSVIDATGDNHFRAVKILHCPASKEIEAVPGPAFACIVKRTLAKYQV